MPNAQLLNNTTTLLNGWRAFNIERPTYGSERSRRIGFHRYIARQTGLELAAAAASIVWCLNCEGPVLRDKSHPVQGGHVCDNCTAWFSVCTHCNEMTYTGSQTITLAQTMVCSRCATREYRFCQTCRGHYRRVYRADHRHGSRSCCDSQERTFTIPFIGHQPLLNDTRVSVTLPSGEISDEGIEQIQAQLINQQYYEDVWDARLRWRNLTLGIEELGTTWQTKQGNYSKRLSSLAYKKYGLKVPPQLLTMVGNIARDNSHGVDFQIETTRELNRGARAFGYPGSCWWQSYSRSRCALKTNGGFGLRTFDEEGVSGRAWVMPLKLEHGALLPTYDTMTPAAYVIFNGYGKLSSYSPARVLSHMTGMTYRKIRLTINPMYINSNAGYLVAGEEVAKDYTDGALALSVSQHSILFEHENRRLVQV